MKTFSFLGSISVYVCVYWCKWYQFPIFVSCCHISDYSESFQVLLCLGFRLMLYAHRNIFGRSFRSIRKEVEIPQVPLKAFIVRQETVGRVQSRTENTKYWNHGITVLCDGRGGRHGN